MPSAQTRIRWLVVLRDVAIVFGLTFVGGFVIGVVGGLRGEPVNVLVLGVSNLITATIGFSIVGSLTREKRWAHLAVVAVGAWLTGLANVALGTTNIFQWVAGIFFVAATMGVGGAISCLIRKNQPNQPPLLPSASVTPSSGDLGQ